MAFSAKFMKKQIKLVAPKLSSLTLEEQRNFQDKLGSLMTNMKGRKTRIERKHFGSFEGAWIYPSETRREGVVLYLHGGGYVCGSLEYALGFGSSLAEKCGMRVFCPAYRLAPEHKAPAAADDAFEAYTYLLECGISPSSIMLCGESAGGGLCYALCNRLISAAIALPAGIIAISPWLDLTLSGDSIEKNKDIDISLDKQTLSFFVESYLGDALAPDDKEASPLFGDVSAMPPSFILVGSDEILLDDALRMHQKLRAASRRCELSVAEGMWHAYLLYDLKESKADFAAICDFVDSLVPTGIGLRWMKLDNAAKIYPAAKRRKWNNMFRLSATMSEPVDRDILRVALDATVRRFPSIAARLRRGAFWYYLEELRRAPEIEDERSSPLMYMPFESIRKCALRVLVYGNRIAVEFYHALTDGRGGLVFLKSLVAEYIERRYGLTVPNTHGILDRREAPRPEELRDSFLDACGDVSKSRAEPSSYRIEGVREKDEFVNLTTFIIDSDKIRDAAHDRGVSVTELICSAIIKATCRIQDSHVARRNQKMVKVLVPVDLRRLFGSETLRNFSLYLTPGIDPRVGEWEFDEICHAVHHQMALGVTKKEMTMRLTKNVKSEKSLIVRIMPLFIKNFVMKSVYDAVGEKKSVMDLSNLGIIQVPSEMEQYVDRFDFIIGTLPNTHENCAVLAYKGKTYISFTRDIQKSNLELYFYEQFREIGIHAKVESNRR